MKKEILINPLLSAPQKKVFVESWIEKHLGNAPNVVYSISHNLATIKVTKTNNRPNNSQ